MIGMMATPKSTSGAGSLPVLSLNADLLKDKGPVANRCPGLSVTARNADNSERQSNRAGLVPHG
jgi:hypothetical protein